LLNRGFYGFKVNRREFIKITGAGIGGAAVAGGVGKVAYGLIKGDSGDVL
jgi:hypothetical protein